MKYDEFMWAKKITILLVFIFGTNFLISCSSFKNGFVSPTQSNYPEFLSKEIDIELLDQEKEKLNKETRQIVQAINDDLVKQQAIRAVKINGLFGNLNNQFQLDFAYEVLYNCSTNDSLREIGWEKLMRSADFYNAEFQSKKPIRKIINRGDVAHHIPKKLLVHSQKFLWKKKNQKGLDLKQIELASSEKTKCGFIREKQKDNVFGTFYKIAGFASQLFGRIVGTIHGKPHPKENINKLMPRLQKWDIVCQKSAKCLTDKFIPGYFGHAGIYLGDSIFVEAIQKGVVYSSPEKFTEGNAFLVIRPRINGEGQALRMEKLLKAQVGKKYDYHFNVESPDRLICTELIYLVFDQIDWETKKVAGRYTISPDDLVKTSLENKELEIPFYFNEKELTKYPEAGFVEDLLKRK